MLCTKTHVSSLLNEQSKFWIRSSQCIVQCVLPNGRWPLFPTKTAGSHLAVLVEHHLRFTRSAPLEHPVHSYHGNWLRVGTFIEQFSDQELRCFDGLFMSRCQCRLVAVPHSQHSLFGWLFEGAWLVGVLSRLPG